MESTVATLLLVTSTVVIACIVVTYAANVVEQTLNTENIPELGRLKSLQNSLLNQTDSFLNQTLPQPAYPNAANAP